MVERDEVASGMAQRWKAFLPPPAASESGHLLPSTADPRMVGSAERQGRSSDAQNLVRAGFQPAPSDPERGRVE